ncbi:MAG: hypothetical protein ACUVQK_14525, partial [Thermogutta sp.]
SVEFGDTQNEPAAGDHDDGGNPRFKYTLKEPLEVPWDKIQNPFSTTLTFQAADGNAEAEDENGSKTPGKELHCVIDITKDDKGKEGLVLQIKIHDPKLSTGPNVRRVTVTEMSGHIVFNLILRDLNGNPVRLLFDPKWIYPGDDGK